MLSLLGPGIIKAIIDSFLGNALDAFKAYQNKQISLEELNVRLRQSLLTAFSEVEKSHAEALAKTYASFMQAVTQSKILQVMWALVVGSQLFVLVWHQIGIPFIVFMGWTAKYPLSGSTVEWAYLLLAACLGMGPVVLRSGPASSGGMIDKLKSAIGK